MGKLFKDAQLVYEDFKKGLITWLEALRDYGVVIDLSANQVLHETTKALREEIRRLQLPYWEQS